MKPEVSSMTIKPIKTPEQHCLIQAITAKEKLFRAQDAAEQIGDQKLRSKARKLLACARSDLEAIDRLLRWNAPTSEGD